MSGPALEVLDVAGAPDRLGEGPWWDVAEQRLLWVDIPGRRIRAARLDGTGAWETTTASEVGFVVPSERGTLLAGLRDGVHELDPAAGPTAVGSASLAVTAVGHNTATHRVNDGKTDRRGRLWFGSMHDAENEATARLYRLDDRGLHTVLERVITSNGLGWSPDDAVMYHTDSITRTISAHDVDPDSGELGGRRVLTVDPRGYVPDGLTVDADGCLWSAKWDGAQVVRYTPGGVVDRCVPLPVNRPTSCMFVGPALDVLAVTTAMTPGVDEPLAGRVLLLDVGARGLPERRATVRPPSPEGA